jgi:protein TonB
MRPLTWSILLHLFALAALAPILAPPELELPPERILQGRLRAEPLREAPALQPEVHREVQPPQRRVSSPSPQPRRLAGEAVVSAIPAVTPAPTFAAVPAAPDQHGGIAAPRESSAPTNVAAARERVEEGPDAAGLRQYRLSLASEARRHKRYPEAARRAGLAGTAEVRIAVTAFDRQAELTRSSGHAVLDSAALDMLRLAAARAPLPEVLLGQRFVVLVPVLFEVED